MIELLLLGIEYRHLLLLDVFRRRTRRKLPGTRLQVTDRRATIYRWSRGLPAFSIASKAEIRNLARSWTLDLSGAGIRVNVLSLGATATPGLLNALARSGKKDAMIAGLIEQSPLAWMAEPDDIADVALFLESDDGARKFADGRMAQV